MKFWVQKPRHCRLQRMPMPCSSRSKRLTNFEFIVWCLLSFLLWILFWNWFFFNFGHDVCSSISVVQLPCEAVRWGLLVPGKCECKHIWCEMCFHSSVSFWKTSCGQHPGGGQKARGYSTSFPLWDSYVAWPSFHVQIAISSTSPPGNLVENSVVNQGKLVTTRQADLWTKTCSVFLVFLLHGTLFTSHKPDSLLWFCFFWLHFVLNQAALREAIMARNADRVSFFAEIEVRLEVQWLAFC